MKLNNHFFPILYSIIGILVATGLFEPYASFPTKEETQIIDAGFSIEKNEDAKSVFSIDIIGESYLVCETIWLPSEDIISFIESSKKSIVKARILKEPSDDTKNCIKLYSLSIANEDIFNFDDALEGRKKVVMFFKLCGFILLLFGVYEFRKQLKK
jgi:hypothetical protein